jgi:hypothetical protein
MIPGDASTGPQAHLTVNPSGQAEADVWRPLALQHLWNARHMAALCRKVEDELIAQGKGNINYEVRGLAMMAVASAAGFAESLINEIFLAATDTRLVEPAAIAGIPPAAVEMMRVRWNPPASSVRRVRFRACPRLRRCRQKVQQVSLKRAPALDKYQFALQAVEKSTAMPKGTQVCQRVQAVFDLRHALLHYWPGWDSERQGEITSRFNQVPRSKQLLADAGFPNQILNADSASWVCDVCVAFVDEWSGHMTLTNPPDTRFQRGDWPAP